MVETSLDDLVEMFLDIVLLLVFQQSLEDVVAFEVLTHQVVNHCYVVAQEELGQVIFTAEDLFLQVFQQQGEVFSTVEMQDHQPLLELSTQVAELHSIVIFHDFES